MENARNCSSFPKSSQKTGANASKTLGLTRNEKKKNSFLFFVFFCFVFFSFSLPGSASGISFPGGLWPTAVRVSRLRGISWVHSYPGVRGCGSRISHSGSDGGIIRFGFIARTGISGGIVSPILVSIASSARVGIRWVHLSRHGGLAGSRVRNLRGISSLASSKGRVVGRI